MIKPGIKSPAKTRELRKFAFSVGPAFIAVFGLVLPYLFNTSWPLWPWILATVLFIWGFVHPVSLQPVYRGWMLLGLLLHRVISPFVLGLMYFGVFTPISIMLRLFGKRLIDTEFDENTVSYRQSATTIERKNYERPF